MSAAIILITLGGMLVYSALKGIGITDVLAGAEGDKLDPAGYRKGFGKAVNRSPGSDAAQDTSNSGPTGQFKGPKAAYLEKMRSIAVKAYDLRITDICRSANAGYGSKTSLHIQCRAFDATGSPADMRAFALYAKSQGGYDELFYDPIGLVAPGFNHTDHVHLGA